MTLTFGFNSARDLLEKARRDYRRLTDAVARQSDQAISDALFDFAITIFHVKDWLKEHRPLPVRPKDVEAFVSGSAALSSFHDLCTAGKHKLINRYPPTTEEVLASAGAPVSPALGGSSPGPQQGTYVTKIVRKDRSRHEAVDLAATALAEWDSFFAQHGL